MPSPQSAAAATPAWKAEPQTLVGSLRCYIGVDPELMAGPGNRGEDGSECPGRDESCSDQGQGKCAYHQCRSATLQLLQCQYALSGLTHSQMVGQNCSCFQQHQHILTGNMHIFRAHWGSLPTPVGAMKQSVFSPCLHFASSCAYELRQKSFPATTERQPLLDNTPESVEDQLLA